MKLETLLNGDEPKTGYIGILSGFESYFCARGPNLNPCSTYDWQWWAKQGSNL